MTGENQLGLGFLSGYLVTFDFPNGVLYLKESNLPNCQNDLDMSGLHLLRIDGKTVIHSIDSGSPATASGVRANDILITLDGQRAEQFSMFALRRCLCAEGKECHVTLSRAGATIEATIVLGKLLPHTISKTNSKQN